MVDKKGGWSSLVRKGISRIKRTKNAFSAQKKGAAKQNSVVDRILQWRFFRPFVIGLFLIIAAEQLFLVLAVTHKPSKANDKPQISKNIDLLFPNTASVKSSSSQSKPPTQLPKPTPAPSTKQCVVSYAQLPFSTVAPLIADLSHGQASAITTTVGPDGLTGVIYKLQTGQDGVAWVTEQHLVILGSLLSPDGTNLTDSAKKKFEDANTTTFMPGDNITFKKLNADQVHSLISLIGFQAVPASPESSASAPIVPMVMFFSPGSKDTKDFWNLTLPFVNNHQLTVELVPLPSSNNPTQTTIAGEIFSAPNQFSAFIQTLDGANQALLTPAANPDLTSNIAANQTIATLLGITATPAFIFRTGDSFLLAQGMPQGGPAELLKLADQFLNQFKTASK